MATDTARPAADGYHDTCRWDVLAQLGPAVGRVLDVGCGAGATGTELLRSGRATAIDGIELSPEVAARTVGYERVVVGDVASVDRSPLRSDYDTMLCNDVLEHLVDPWSVLRTLVADHLRPGGTALVSLPNIQCAEVVAPLIGGRFDYADHGILDRTHLRFFTASTGRSLLVEAGLELVARSDSRIGATHRGWRRHVGRALGPFGVRQYLFTARRPLGAAAT